MHLNANFFAHQSYFEPPYRQRNGYTLLLALPSPCSRWRRVYETLLRSSVCPSVHPSVCCVRPSYLAPQACLLLWVRRAGDIDRLLHSRRTAGECGQCRVVSVCSSWTQTCFIGINYMPRTACVDLRCESQTFIFEDTSPDRIKTNSRRYTSQDETVAPACRPPPRRRPGRQLCLAAWPHTRSDVVCHAKCKHSMDGCIRLDLNFFTKCHATRVI